MKRKNYAIFMALPGNDFSTNITMGAARAVDEQDANLVIFPTGLFNNMGYEIEVSLYRYQYNSLSCFMGASSLDGALIEFGTITAMLDREKKNAFLNICRQDMPIVLLVEDADRFAGISFDNQSGIREIVRHFVTVHGCKKIAFLSGPKDNEDARIRLSAFKEAMAQFGLEPDESMIAYGHFSYKVKPEMDMLMKANPDLEAIICANDDMAMGAMDYLKSHGKKVGRDVLISGFDDQPKSCVQDPPLTTVKADARKLAYRAMNAIVKGETNCNLPNVKTEIVIRESCGCKMLARTQAENPKGMAKEAKRMLSVDLSLIEKDELNHVFFGEVELLMREAIYYQDSQNDWMNALLRSFIRLGYERCFMFFYDEPISNTHYEEWRMPEKMNLIASLEGTQFTHYEPGDKVYQLDRLFDSDITDMDKRCNLIVIPLFYREKHLGMIVADGPIHLVKFAYQLGSMVSNAIEMIRVQQTNRRLVKELEQASNAKSQFLANMSHEIRTPINAIMGMNEMIRRDSAKMQKEEPQMKEYLGRIEEYSNDIGGASNTLLSIVNDILDLSKIESDKLTIIPVEYRLDEMVESIYKQIGFKNRSKDVEMRLEFDRNLPCMLYGDDLRIRQILINILGNAVKYTQKGEVVFHVGGHVEADYVILDIYVKDTGIGIKEEDMHKLFEKFERIEEKRNRNIEGTGLGMNITVSLLSMMDSKLNVESVYGEGSTFSFALKQKIVDATAICDADNEVHKTDEEEEKEHNYQGARVLVVDDNDINRKVILFMMNNSGILFDEATNGKECLEKMQQNTYDLILLDHMMPVMDGMETIAKIQEMPGYQKGKPGVVVLTANAIVGADKEYLDAGFDAYLSKPIEPKALNEILRRFL